MQSLSSELRGVIEGRLRAAGPREILAIASALCATPETSAAARDAATDGPRFTVQGDVVSDRTTGLTWTRKNVGDKALDWKAAKAACAAARVGGYEDWRLPTIQELLTLVDYSRVNPAIDTAAFECESSWYWTSTPAASSSYYAWIVNFDYGYSHWNSQGGEFRVRAVRPGQIVGSSLA